MLLNKQQSPETVKQSFAYQLPLKVLRSILISVPTGLLADGARRPEMSFADNACEVHFDARVAVYDSVCGTVISMLAPLNLQNGYMVMIHPLLIRTDLARFPALVDSPEDLAKPLCCG